MEASTDRAATFSALSPGADEIITESPKLPIDPPRRRSSLGFSKMAAMSTQGDLEQETDGQNILGQSSLATMANTSKKRVAVIRNFTNGTPPYKNVETDPQLQSINAFLHVDMQYAASPNGSLDSRLFSEPTPTLHSAQGNDDAEELATASSTRWRYSTVPSIFATATADVREPIPSESPLLPRTNCYHRAISTPSHEPASSGHLSLSNDDPSDDPDDLPPLPPSSPPSSDQNHDSSPNLEQRMMALDVSSDTESVTDETSPLMIDSESDDHLNEAENISMSQSVKAAADYARRKRGIAHGGRPAIDHDSRVHSYQQPTLGYVGSLSRASPVSMHCPNPLVHLGADGPHAGSAQSHIPSSPHFHLGRPYFPNGPFTRISAAGSPVPFRKPTSKYDTRDHQACFLPQAPAAIYQSPQLEPTLLSQSSSAAMSEHFRPGWYYTNASPQLSQDRGQMYSFSTAAAKASGDSIAPDSRIRDSYRTDTLTPLAKPPNRYRKNGIGAEIQIHKAQALCDASIESAGSPGRPVQSVERPASGNSGRLESRGSPSDLSMRYLRQRGTKRGRPLRAQTPDFEISDDGLVHAQIKAFEKQIQLEDRVHRSTRVANGESDATSVAVRELSPNVRIWRKGIGMNAHLRKRRRPSYWDGDLKEIKMSPAARGGIASSPIMSKSSMIADVDCLSGEGSNSDLSGKLSESYSEMSDPAAPLGAQSSTRPHHGAAGLIEIEMQDAATDEDGDKDTNSTSDVAVSTKMIG